MAKFTLRVPVFLYRRLKDLAIKDGQSLQEFITQKLEAEASEEPIKRAKS